MGRPPKYDSDDARLLARKEQNRTNVRRYRERKRERVRSASDTSLIGPGTHLFPPPFLTSTSASSRSSSAESDTQWWIEELARPNIEPTAVPFRVIEAVLHYFQSTIGVFSWPEALHKLRTNDKLLETAILAFSTRWAARRYADDRLAEFSRRAFCVAEQLKRQQLQESAPQKVVLFSVVNLAFQNFEAFDGREDNNLWLHRFEDSTVLMKQAGPKAFQSPLGLQLLRLVHRPRITFAGFFARCALFIDDVEWRTVPFGKSSLTPDDKLWQLSQKIPEYLQRLDLLKFGWSYMGPTPTFDSPISLWGELMLLHQQLEDWWTTTFAEHDQPLFWKQAASLDFIWNTDDIFGEAIGFPNLELADRIVNYWGTLLYLLMACLEVTEMFSNLGLWGYASAVNVHPSYAATLASNICRATEYLFGGRPGHCGGTVMRGQHSLMAAFHFFNKMPERYARELEWCGSLRQIARTQHAHKTRWFDLFFDEFFAVDNMFLNTSLRQRLATAVRKEEVYVNC